MKSLKPKLPQPSVASLALACSMIFALSAIFAALPSEAQVQSGFKDGFQSNEIIVSLVPGSDINEFNAQFGTSFKDQIPGSNQYLLSLPAGISVADKLEEVAKSLDLEFSGPNFNFQSAEIRQRSQAFIDQRSQAFIDGQSPVNFYGQAPLRNLHLPEAQQISRGYGVKVAVIDTGIDFAHPLFAGRIAHPVYDFVDNDFNPTDEPGGAGYGHGTFVSGLIALTATGAQIMPIRAFDQNGFGTTFNVAKAIRFAADNGAQITNMSFGLLEKDKLIDEAITYAHNKTFQVAAVGNDNVASLHFPSLRKAKAFGVASTNDNDTKAAFSNFGREVQVAAPGVNLYSAYPGNRWAYWSGTSFSTALVSGEAALLLQLNPKLNRSAMNTILTNSGVAINALNPTYAGKLGSVRIDFLSAVKRTLSGK